MRKSIDPLAESRLDGDTIGLGCQDCAWRSLCGGWTRQGGGWSCASRCRDCNPTECDLVCFNNESFVEDFAEVRGFGFEDIGPVRQNQGMSIPEYVPLINNGSSRAEPLDIEWAAVPLSSLMANPKTGAAINVEDSFALKEKFGLTEKTRVIVVGINVDEKIEPYWRWRKENSLPEQIARLMPTWVIVPNYSFELSHPRTQHLFNRKRSLICADELSSVGVPSVLYLQAVNDADYDYWFNFLWAHEEVDTVCKEFQTGNAIYSRGVKTIQSIAALQDRLGRALHIVAVAGGGQYSADFGEYFDQWSIIDSVPFMRAHRRRGATLLSNPTSRENPKKIIWRKEVDRSPTELLARNISCWQSYLLSLRRKKQLGGALRRIESRQGARSLPWGRMSRDADMKSRPKNR